MLSRAESFGRKEAHRDQQESAMAGEVGKFDQAVSAVHQGLEPSTSHGSISGAIPTTPRRSLVRSSTLTTIDVSPSKQRTALTRTTSMPLSPVKNSTLVPTQILELERKSSISANGIPARRTYGKAQRLNSQVDAVISQPPPVTGETSTQLSPIPQSSVADLDVALSSPSRPLLAPRESYADLVKRLEMDDEEESQGGEELDGSMVSEYFTQLPSLSAKFDKFQDYLRNAQSLAELRSKGENRKFMDDLTWLIDGLNDDALPVRRSR